MDDVTFSIDVRKNFLEQLKDIYKALTMISQLQARNDQARANAIRTLDAVAAMYKVNTAPTEDAVVKQYTAMLDAVNSTVLDRFSGRDYASVFEKYISA